MMQELKGSLELIRKKFTRDQLDLAFILGFIESRKDNQKSTRLIDLVNENCFGNGSAVHQKIQRLINLNFLVFRKNTLDPFEKMIAVTNLGSEWLNKTEKDIQRLFKTSNEVK